MESGVRVDATAGHQSESGFRRDAAVTRSLLGYGVIVGPFYLIVGLLQAFLRDGFDLARHSLSGLANGPAGWIQTGNLALSGLMVLAAAVGFARTLASRAVSWSLGAFGMGMIVAAVFPADPVDGFPPGTPEGFPASISAAGLVLFIAGATGFISLAISCFASARAMSRRSMPGLARISFGAGSAVLLGFFGGAALATGSLGILGIWFSVVVGWAWLAVMSLHLYRVSPDPNCTPSR